jgi:hypothetical protein
MALTASSTFWTTHQPARGDWRCLRPARSARAATWALSEVVIRKCEGDFVTKLSTSQRQSYERQQKRCSRKCQNASGTMYRSFEAFCGANLAKDYARRFAHSPKT